MIIIRPDHQGAASLIIIRIRIRGGARIRTRDPRASSPVEQFLLDTLSALAAETSQAAAEVAVVAHLVNGYGYGYGYTRGTRGSGTAGATGGAQSQAEGRGTRPQINSVMPDVEHARSGGRGQPRTSSAAGPGMVASDRSACDRRRRLEEVPNFFRNEIGPTFV